MVDVYRSVSVVAVDTTFREQTRTDVVYLLLEGGTNCDVQAEKTFTRRKGRPAATGHLEPSQSA